MNDFISELSLSKSGSVALGSVERSVVWPGRVVWKETNHEFLVEVEIVLNHFQVSLVMPPFVSNSRWTEAQQRR